MRLLGNLLVWICLATGLIGATSFYAWPVGSDTSADDRFVIAHDAHDAAVHAVLLRDVRTLDGNVIAKADAPLDPPTLAFLREAGVERVSVKHPGGAFGRMFANWTGKWVFLGSVAGLVAGAMLLRTAARRDVEQAPLSDRPIATPEDIASRIRAAIADLRGSLPAMGSETERMAAIVRELGEVQAELVPAFVETRAALVARRGMGDFARVMDSFAGMERKINRAWSASADGVYHESSAALDEAAIAADELLQTLEA